MSNSRPPPNLNDVSGKRSRISLPRPAATTTEPCIRSSTESTSSSDPLESPTLHCYVAGRRPKRTIPRRALSTGITIDPAALATIDLRLRSGTIGCTTNMTPPRSKSVVTFRRMDSGINLKDAPLFIPNLGDRSIYTPLVPPLSRFYEDNNRMSIDDEMDLDTTLAIQSIVRSISSMKVDSPSPPLKGVPMMASYPRRRQPSPHPLRRNSKYFSDEEMHIATSTEDDDIEVEIQSPPKYHTMSSTRPTCIELQNQGQNPSSSGKNPCWFSRITSRTFSNRSVRLSMPVLQVLNQNLSPPSLFASKCETSSVVDKSHITSSKSNRGSLILPFARY